MPTNVQIQFLVPVSEEDWGPTLVFTHWLPLAEGEAIEVIHGSLELRLWLDMQCLGHVSDIAVEAIPLHVNLNIARVHIDVTMPIDDELADLVYRARDWSRSTEAEAREREANTALWTAWGETGKQALAAAMGILNRLLLFARNQKGQFWIEPLEMNLDRMPSRNIQFHAQVKVPPHDWVRWNPPGLDVVVARMTSEDRYISEADWHDVRSFLNSSTRPDLVLELLANAESLLRAGRRRSAVIEAVTALEVALFEFAKAPRAESFRTEVIGRTPIDAIRHQVEHLGFTGSMRYFLPLLFPEESLTHSTLETCWSAIETRQNVVHSGQRDVQETLAQGQIGAVRQVCELLRDSTRIRARNDTRQSN